MISPAVAVACGRPELRAVPGWLAPEGGKPVRRCAFWRIPYIRPGHPARDPRARADQGRASHPGNQNDECMIHDVSIPAALIAGFISTGSVSAISIWLLDAFPSLQNFG